MILKRFYHIKKILKPKKDIIPPGNLIAEPHLVQNKTYTLDLPASNQLPIYRNNKNGIPITTIRKIVGSVEDLAAEISKFISKDSVCPKPILRQIIIKGNYTDALKNWFTMNKL